MTPLKPAVKVAIACGTAFVGGVGCGIFGTKLHLDKIYEERAEQELTEAKRYYNRLNKREEFASPIDLVEANADVIASDMIKDLKYISEAVDSVDDELELTRMTEVVKNVFTDYKSVEGVELEEALAKRSPDHPYILTREEFFASDLPSQTLTYFEGDNVLSDEKDEHVRDIDDTVGEANLLRFGLGSKDNNVVYICNERLDVNFEVLRSQGKYAEEVLGFIEHSEKRRPPKFRRDDE